MTRSDAEKRTCEVDVAEIAVAAAEEHVTVDVVVVAGAGVRALLAVQPAALAHHLHHTTDVTPRGEAVHVTSCCHLLVTNHVCRCDGVVSTLLQRVVGVAHPSTHCVNNF